MTVERKRREIGLDTNIVCYALDPAFPEHKKATRILRQPTTQFRVAINPTVVHETYHILVYKQKWVRDEACRRLVLLMRQRIVSFLNQTKSISQSALYLANKYDLGGRDSLIISNYLLNNIVEVYTHDLEILKLGRVSIKDKELILADPLE